MSDGTQFSLRGYDWEAGQDQTYTFTGRLLSEASSQSPRHVSLVHGPTQFAPPGERCSACRWFEVRIYASDVPHTGTDGQSVPTWIIETVGKTVVPGEQDRRRVRKVHEPRRVVGSLVQQREGDSFIPAVSRRALDQAADADPRLAGTIDDLLVF